MIAQMITTCLDSEFSYYVALKNAEVACFLTVQMFVFRDKCHCSSSLSLLNVAFNHQKRNLILVS